MSLSGDLDSIKLMTTNMKNHLTRKMIMDEDSPENYTDEYLVRFLETCFGFANTFTVEVVEEWRDENE